MKFPNAAKGIKKIFAAEIFDLIAILLTGIASLFAIASLASAAEKSEIAAGISIVGAGIFVTVAGIIAIVSLIIGIVGYIQTAKDEQSFKAIIYLNVFAIIIAVIGGFFAGNQTASTFIQLISQAVSLVTTILVVLGINNMAMYLKRQDVVDKCEKFFKVIICLGIVSILLKCLSAFMNNQVAQVIAVISVIAAIVISIVQYILYLSILARAKKMLNE